MSSSLADRHTDHEARREQAKRADDIRTLFRKTFAGQATEEQGAKCLELIKSFCLAHQDPGTAAGFDTNRTFTIVGRQTVWREIERALSPITSIPA